jgi:hypothetical protein
MPSFNYDAAIKAGAKPEEISAYLAKRKSEGVDLAAQAVKPSQPARRQGFLDKAAGASNKFLGALAGFTGMDKATGTDMNKTFAVPKFSGKQLTGDVLTLASTGLNLAAPGSGSLGKTVLANAGAAGLLGAGNDLTQGKSAGEAVGNGLVKGAIAGGMTGLLGLIGKGISAVTKKLPQAVVKSSYGLPNKTDASVLLDEGLTGARDAVKPKLTAAFADANARISAAPEITDLVQPGRALKSPQLQQIMKDLDTLGPDTPEYAAAKKVLDTKLFNRPGAMPRGALLKLTSAIDRNTSNAAFADKATGVEARTENALADAYRGITHEGSGAIESQLKRESVLSALKNAITAYDNAKARGIPGTGGSFLQRTVMSPAVATPIAQLGHNTGKFLDSAGQNAIVQAMKRIGRVGSIGALGKF